MLDSAVPSTFEHLSGQNLCSTIKWHARVLFARGTLLFLFYGTLFLIENKSAGLQVSNEKCVSACLKLLRFVVVFFNLWLVNDSVRFQYGNY